MIHILIDDEELELIEYFLFENNIKADPNIFDPNTFLTPICNAIQNGNFEIVKLLVKASADLDLPSDNMIPS